MRSLDVETKERIIVVFNGYCFRAGIVLNYFEHLVNPCIFEYSVEFYQDFMIYLPFFMQKPHIQLIFFEFKCSGW